MNTSISYCHKEVITNYTNTLSSHNGVWSDWHRALDISSYLLLRSREMELDYIHVSSQGHWIYAVPQQSSWHFSNRVSTLLIVVNKAKRIWIAVILPHPSSVNNHCLNSSSKDLAQSPSRCCLGVTDMQTAQSVQEALSWKTERNDLISWSDWIRRLNQREKKPRLSRLSSAWEKLPSKIVQVLGKGKQYVLYLL